MFRRGVFFFCIFCLHLADILYYSARMSTTLPNASQKKERVPQLSIHQVRGQLFLRGMSIKSWAESRGYSRFSICHAMAGRRIGPKHRHMLELLQKDTGL